MDKNISFVGLGVHKATIAVLSPFPGRPVHAARGLSKVAREESPTH